MNKKILISLGLLIFILNLDSQVEARRRGEIISSGVSEVQPQPGTWTYRKLVTISSSMISATAGTLTNFPVLVSWGTDTAIASHAQASGNDIKFMSYDTTTQLFHEREYYEGTSGKGVFWVNIPELTSATYTFWMYYGNPSANYQGTTATWNSNYRGVWHLNETTEGITYDSTINRNNGVQSGNVTLNVAGRINGAYSFDGVNDYIVIGDNGSLNYGTTFTIEAWCMTSLSAWRWLVTKSGGSWFGVSWNGNLVWTRQTGVDYISTGFVADGIWHYGVVTFNNGELKIYRDGVEVGIWSAVTLLVTSGMTYIGQRGDNVEFFNGMLDEIRISNTTRSADWIATSYNNQSNPSAYITIGAEETL